MGSSRNEILSLMTTMMMMMMTMMMMNHQLMMMMMMMTMMMTMTMTTMMKSPLVHYHYLLRIPLRICPIPIWAPSKLRTCMALPLADTLATATPTPLQLDAATSPVMLLLRPAAPWLSRPRPEGRARVPAEAAWVRPGVDRSLSSSWLDWLGKGD